MSTLATSYKQVLIDINSINALVIRNAKINNLSQSNPILFKIKTNMKDLVDVRPAFGVLLDNRGQKSIALIKIKFTGQKEDIEKTKLLIKWVPITGDNYDIKQQPTHNEFNEIYKKALQNLPYQQKQGSLILPFRSNQKQNDIEQQSLSGNHQVIRSKDDGSIVKQEPNMNKQEQKIKAQQNIENESKAVGNKSKGGFSLMVLIILMILSLVTGVFVGNCLEKNQLLNQISSRLVTSNAEDLVSVQQKTQNISVKQQIINKEQAKHEQLQQFKQINEQTIFTKATNIVIDFKQQNL